MIGTIKRMCHAVCGVIGFRRADDEGEPTELYMCANKDGVWGEVHHVGGPTYITWEKSNEH